jgi:hypothetical protein
MTDYTQAAATRILATHCAFCARPLVDAASVEAGVGPICRKKYAVPNHLGEATRTKANKLIHTIAVTQDPAEIKKGIVTLSLMGCDAAATKLADRIGAIVITEADDRRFAFTTGRKVSDACFTALRKITGRRWNKETKTTTYAGGSFAVVAAAVLAFSNEFRGVIRYENGDNAPQFFAIGDIADVPVIGRNDKVETAQPKAKTTAETKKGQKVADLAESFPYDPAERKDRKQVAALLEKQLHAAGFERVVDSMLPSFCREEVFEIKVAGRTDKPEVGNFVRVYTSIVGDEVRSEGKDAIRVLAFARFWKKVDGKWELRTKNLGKETRVNRTGTWGGIVNRVIGRCRNSYRVALTDYREWQVKKEAA